mmetsp:Transcript_6642/g.20695  ORF Transcript_6642/g.20695 Transcript_6642/m.20695 type:complete len:204 (+) Transcript_6642:2590-3201(+)
MACCKFPYLTGLVTASKFDCARMASHNFTTLLRSASLTAFSTSVSTSKASWSTSSFFSCKRANVPAMPPPKTFAAAGHVSKSIAGKILCTSTGVCSFGFFSAEPPSVLLATEPDLVLRFALTAPKKVEPSSDTSFCFCAKAKSSLSNFGDLCAITQPYFRFFSSSGCAATSFLSFSNKLCADVTTSTSMHHCCKLLSIVLQIM